ncbi:MAG: hypothetical protein ABIR15_14745 [Chitinophagaceae bacterium]
MSTTVSASEKPNCILMALNGGLSFHAISIIMSMSFCSIEALCHFQHPNYSRC